MLENETGPTAQSLALPLDDDDELLSSLMKDGQEENDPLLLKSIMNLAESKKKSNFNIHEPAQGTMERPSESIGATIPSSQKSSTPDQYKPIDGISQFSPIINPSNGNSSLILDTSLIDDNSFIRDLNTLPSKNDSVKPTSEGDFPPIRSGLSVLQSSGASASISAAPDLEQILATMYSSSYDSPTGNKNDPEMDVDQIIRSVIGRELAQSDAAIGMQQEPSGAVAHPKPRSNTDVWAEENSVYLDDAISRFGGIEAYDEKNELESMERSDAIAQSTIDIICEGIEMDMRVVNARSNLEEANKLAKHVVSSASTITQSNFNVRAPKHATVEELLRDPRIASATDEAIDADTLLQSVDVLEGAEKLGVPVPFIHGLTKAIKGPTGASNHISLRSDMHLPSGSGNALKPSGADLGPLESIISQYSGTANLALSNSRTQPNASSQNKKNVADIQDTRSRLGSLEDALSPHLDLMNPDANEKSDPAANMMVQSAILIRQAALREKQLLFSGNDKIISPLSLQRRVKKLLTPSDLRSFRWAVKKVRSGLAFNPTGKRRLSSDMDADFAESQSIRGSVDGTNTWDGDHLSSLFEDHFPVDENASIDTSRFNMFDSIEDRYAALCAYIDKVSGPGTSQSALVTGKLTCGKLLAPEEDQLQHMLSPLSMQINDDTQLDTLLSSLQTLRSRTGAIQLEPKHSASEILRTICGRRNITDPNKTSGQLTCMAVHPRFIAVGTSQGIVALLDRQTQGCTALLTRGTVPPPPSGQLPSLSSVLAAAQAERDGPVTAIDAIPSLNYILVGYNSGRIALFEVPPNDPPFLVRSVEYFDHSITAVKFISHNQLHAVAVDNRGTLSSLTFNKVLGLRWTSDHKVVISGHKTGPILALSVHLSAPSRAPQQSSVLSSLIPSVLSSNNSMDTLIAASTADYTFILGTNPEIMIYHRWARPDSVPASVVPTTMWMNLKVAGTSPLDAVEERKYAAATLGVALAGAGAPLAASIGAGDPSRAEKAAASAASKPAESPVPRRRSFLSFPSSRRNSNASIASEIRDLPKDASGGVANPPQLPPLASVPSPQEVLHVADPSTAPNATDARTIFAATAKAAAAARLRNGSTLPHHGVVTVTALPTLVRAWGKHLQFLQVQPTAGYPIEHTNLGQDTALAQMRQVSLAQRHAMKGIQMEGGHSGPGAAAVGRDGKGIGGFLNADVVGHFTAVASSALASITQNAPQSTRPCEFILADDFEADEPIVSLGHLTESQVLFLTLTGKLVLFDTSIADELDMITLDSFKPVAVPRLRLMASRNMTSSSSEPVGGVAHNAPVAPALVSAMQATSRPLPANLGSTVDGSSALEEYVNLPYESLLLLSSSTQGSIVSIDGLTYLLGKDSLMVVRSVGWLQRVRAMIVEDNWISALALALDTYETVKNAHLTMINNSERHAQWTALRAATLSRIAQSSGATIPANIVDGGRNVYDPAKFERLRAGAGPTSPGTPLATEIEKLLRDFIQEMFSTLPPAPHFTPGSQATMDHKGSTAARSRAVSVSKASELDPTSSSALVVPASDSSSKLRRIERNLMMQKIKSNQFGPSNVALWTIFAGICIDYCITIQRTDILFGEIFEAFANTNNTPILLEQLEPYIITGRLTNLPPRIMKEFVGYFRLANKLDSVERCLFQLDLASLDIDNCIKICLWHRLYSAFVCVTSQKLHDFSLAFDVPLCALYDGGTGCASLATRDQGKAALPELLDLLGESAAQRSNSHSSDSAKSHDGRSRAGSLDSLSDAIIMKPSERLNQGYALLLFILYSFQEKRFPQGAKQTTQYSSPTSLAPLLPPHLLETISLIFTSPPAELLSSGTAAPYEQGMDKQPPPAPAKPASRGFRGLVPSNPKGSSVPALRFGGASSAAPPAPRSSTGVNQTPVSGSLLKTDVPSTPKVGSETPSFHRQVPRTPFSPFIKPSLQLTTPSRQLMSPQRPGANARRGGPMPQSSPPSVVVSVFSATAGATLRSRMLSTLLERSPDRFPSLSPSMVSHGGLTPGFRILQSSFSGPLPRVQSLLAFDAVAFLSVMNTLFVEANEIYLQAVLMSEGLEGFRLRRLSLPGDFPPLITPQSNGESNIPLVPFVHSTDAKRLSPTEETPDLMTVLIRILRASYLLAGVYLAESTDADESLRAYSNARAGNSIEAILPVSHAATIAESDPQLAVVLLFVAHQLTRLGVGIVPTVNLSVLQKAIPSALGDILLYLSAKSPEVSIASQKRDYTATQGPQNLSSLNGPNALRSTISSFSNSAISTLVEEWEIPHGDSVFTAPAVAPPDPMYAAPKQDKHAPPTSARTGRKVPAGTPRDANFVRNWLAVAPQRLAQGWRHSVYMFIRSAEMMLRPNQDNCSEKRNRSNSDGTSSVISALVPSTPMNMGPQLSSVDSGSNTIFPSSQVTREILLIRMLLIYPLPMTVLDVLYNRVKDNGLILAEGVLAALRGDIKGILSALLNQGRQAKLQEQPLYSLDKSKMGTTAPFPSAQRHSMLSPQSRIFDFLELVLNVLPTGSTSQYTNTLIQENPFEELDELHFNEGDKTAHTPDMPFKGAAASSPLFAHIPPPPRSLVALLASLLCSNVSYSPDYLISLMLLMKYRLLVNAATTQSSAANNVSFTSVPSANGPTGAETPLDSVFSIQEPRSALDLNESFNFSSYLPATAKPSQPITELTIHTQLPEETSKLILEVASQFAQDNLVPLMDLDAPRTMQIILQYFPARTLQWNSSLNRYPELQFQYLLAYFERAGISIQKQPTPSSLVDFSTNLIRDDATAVSQGAYSFTSEIYILFLRLLCTYRPFAVFDYVRQTLSTSSFKVDSALNVVRKFPNVTDATAYLLELTGDIIGALETSLNELENKVKTMFSVVLTQETKKFKVAEENRTAYEQVIHFSVVPDIAAPEKPKAASARGSSSAFETNEEEAYIHALTSAIALCTRTSSRYTPSDTIKPDAMWFGLLNTLVKGQLDLKSMQSVVYQQLKAKQTILDKSTSRAFKTLNETSSGFARLVPDRSPLAAVSNALATIQVALGEGLRMVLEGMKTTVSLPLVLEKVWRDHSNAELGEFRDLIGQMLSTLDSDRSIRETVLTLMDQDNYFAAKKFRDKHVVGLTPLHTNGVCTACQVALTEMNVPSSKASQNKFSSAQTVIFGCGHPYHGSCVKESMACLHCASKPVSEEREYKEISAQDREFPSLLQPCSLDDVYAFKQKQQSSVATETNKVVSQPTELDKLQATLQIELLQEETESMTVMHTQEVHMDRIRHLRDRAKKTVHFQNRETFGQPLKLATAPVVSNIYQKKVDRPRGARHLSSGLINQTVKFDIVAELDAPLFSSPY